MYVAVHELEIFWMTKCRKEKLELSVMMEYWMHIPEPPLALLYYTCEKKWKKKKVVNFK